MTRTTALVSLFALVLSGAATAHAPTTAIGRAVEALRSGDVSYDPAAAVTEVEAGNFELIAGDGVYVALLPTAALTEISGGPNAVAREIAREASLHGTLVVLVGTRLTAWSDRIAAVRLVNLVRRSSAGTPATRVAALVRAVSAEPRSGGGGVPWGWVAAGVSVALIGAAVLLRSKQQAPGTPARMPGTGQ